MDHPDSSRDLCAELLLVATAPPDRTTEPVTCGIPWPRGLLTDPSQLCLEDDTGHLVPLQATALDRWPDASARWVLLDWKADVRERATYRLRLGTGPASPETTSAGLRLTQRGEEVTVDAGPVSFRLHPGGPFPFAAVTTNSVPAIDVERSGLRVEDANGRSYRPVVQRVIVEEAGPLRVAVLVEAELLGDAAEPLVRMAARLHFFAGSAVVRFALTLHNPRRAVHPGGLWDLGDAGSVFLRDAALVLALPNGEGPAMVRCSPEMGAAFEDLPLPLELYQDSSGGENWKSSNHLNRQRVVPNTFRGYRLRAGSQERNGLRATPVVVLSRGDRTLAVAWPSFWQNFPKAVEADAGQLVLRLVSPAVCRRPRDPGG